MMKMNLLQVFFILMGLAVCTIATAQDDYVVTFKGDTITGKIKFLAFSNTRSVQIVKAEQKTTYTIFETKAFRLNNEIYKPVRTLQGYTFMKILKEGYLSLYAYLIENQTRWDGRMLLKLDGESLEVPNLGFKKFMSKFLGDCPQVTKKIESGELPKNKINEIIDQYNFCIEERSKSSNDTTANKAEISTVWLDLENAIRNGNEFEKRSDALEIIIEIKTKIQKAEKVPNFLIEGLKSSLQDQSDFKDLLNKALDEIR